MIKKIGFSGPSDYFKQYRSENGDNLKLANLAQINFLVGPNNSGKSRLLRGLVRELFHYQNLSNNPVRFRNDDFSIALFEIRRTTVYSAIRMNLERIGAELDGDNGKQFYEKIMPNLPVYNEHNIAQIVSNLRDRLNKDLIETIQSVTDSDQDTQIILNREEKEIYTYFRSILPFQNHRFKVTYVPVLRSLRSLYETGGKEDWTMWRSLTYKNVNKAPTGSLQLRTLLDYFIQENGQKNPMEEMEYDLTVDVNTIFTGERLYDQVLSLRMGKESQRSKLVGFEAFLSKSFFNGQKVEINSIKDERGEDVHIKIGEEKEFPIYALGDGIQAVILLTFSLFFNQGEKGQVVFYEEPELFLHPGMQRIFIDVLRQFPEVQFFIATHSNHLLDTSFDHPEAISIYAFEKRMHDEDAIFTVKALNSPALSLLNQLGVRNSSVFLSNCTIWVEGISDRLYLRKYLQLYMDKSGDNFKEDLHYSFLEFGGNNIVHYDFADEPREGINAKKITSRIFLIHDADKGKETRHELLFHQLGENYHKLPVLEIENLLSPLILQLTLQDFRKTGTDKLEFKVIEPKAYYNLPLAEIVNKTMISGQLKKIFSSSPGKEQS